METQHSGTWDMYQFYPTPRDLAKRVWNKLINKHPDRVLEPHAGKGDLLRHVRSALRVRIPVLFAH